MTTASSQLSQELRLLALRCGGDAELAFLLHLRNARSIWGYRAGKYRPSRTVCYQLARLSHTLYGADDERASAQWWLDVDR